MQRQQSCVEAMHFFVFNNLGSGHVSSFSFTPTRLDAGANRPNIFTTLKPVYSVMTRGFDLCPTINKLQHLQIPVATGSSAFANYVFLFSIHFV